MVTDPSLGATPVIPRVLVVFLLIFAIWAVRWRWLTWRVLTGGWLIVGAVLMWFAWDDPVVRRPLSIDEISPALKGDDISYAAIMEYGKLRPSEEALAFIATQPKVQFGGRSPKDADKWIEFITTNRADLETDWTTSAPQRAWLERLNAFNRLGDLTPTNIDADVPRFDPWRFLSQRTSAIACLQALDGRGDEAVATLLPMLEVSRKFEISSRTLARLMISRVSQRICYETAGFILAHSNPGAEARARLFAALDGEVSVSGARRIPLIEYAFLAPTFDKLAKLPLKDAINYFGGAVRYHSISNLPNLLKDLVYDPRATKNLFGDYVYDLAALAAARDLPGVATKEKDFRRLRLQGGGLKNIGGRAMLSMVMVPNYQTIIKNYWEVEDARLAVLVRLKPPS